MSATQEIPRQKRPYSTPKLSTYGDLARMTTTTTPDAKNKDGGPNNTKSF
jgi:hypothetical protein